MEAPSDSAGCGTFSSTLPSIHRSRLPRLRRGSPDLLSIARITLSAKGGAAAGLPFPERHIMLDATNNTIIIGRASKTSSKGFLAEPDNGWFDSAVMSRKHAEIKADVDTKKVKIRDLGSLHGTFLNDSPDGGLDSQFQELNDGDNIRFGVGVWRGSENFMPTTVKVGIVFDHRNERASSTFRVPEDSDNESDTESYSNKGDRTMVNNASIIVTGARRVSETIDLTKPRAITHVSHAAAQKGAPATEIIDLSSPPQSPAMIDDEDVSEAGSVFELREMPNHPIEAPLPAQIIEGEAEVENGGPDVDDGAYLDEISDINPDDDQLSLDCESDEERGQFTDSDVENESSTSSVVGDPAESYGSYEIDSEQSSDIDDVESESSSFDGSDNDEDVGNEDNEDIDEDAIDRCYGELDDTSDEEDPSDPFWSHNQFNVSDLLPESTASAMKPPPPVTISGLLNSDTSATSSYPPTLRPSVAPKLWESDVLASQTQRPHSPSDVLMSKTCGKPADGSQEKTGTEFLGQKSGKHDYFAAREVNKISVQKQAVAVSSLHSLCNSDRPAIGNFNIYESPPLPVSAAPADPIRLPQLSYHFGPLNLLATEAAANRTGANIPKETARAATPEPAEVISNQDETLAVAPTAQQSALPPSEAASGLEVGRRTRLGIADIVEDCMKTADERKGKRKVKDISTLSEAEEEWSAENKGVPAMMAVPISPTPSSISEPMQAREASPAPAEVEMADTEPLFVHEVEKTVAAVVSEPEYRAPKRQRLIKIAERVGYAALGGVTAGAMIVGTLIYTAPTF
ncbi:hypothetical protein QBC34DRAFT_194974 [Podospora aff. communis PSN243]|uniref:FHA domain-containing protein n=1 Tax=Podospora aff. communis PSN243 TaxID=3040156 RepID=A0AAV9H1F6_9PEZI|nr:hypothetical protein QBC34DRAFT_194974 [Podospora aff. communis PSN243]